MKPFIKCVGGKRKLVDTILELVPNEFNKYHEPFVGGGALFFDMIPNQSYLSDLNESLIVTYKAVRNSVTKVITHLQTLKNTRECFEAVRRNNFQKGEFAQRAAEFIYCNKTGFNGLFRVNGSGQFNVPFGKYDNPTICDVEQLKAASIALRGTNLLPIDFETSAQYVKEGDLWYADPPYMSVSVDTSFTAYTKEKFHISDQKRLCDVAVELRKRGAHVILSNSSAPFVYELYTKAKFKIKEVQMARNINSDGAGRGKVKELLIYGKMK